MNKPAYTSVVGGRTITPSGRPTANVTGPPVSNGDKNNKTQWPPSLKNFVQRCYEGVVNDDTRIAIEREMKQIITQRAQDGTLWTTDWDSMPLPTPLSTPLMEPTTVKRSRFDVEPVSISLAKRLRTEPQSTPSTNPLSESESDSMEEIAIIEQETPQPAKKKKNKNKSAFAKYGEVIGQTKDELERRDRRMQRFSEIEARATPPRVDTPDYVRDAQIAASISSSLPDDRPFIGRSQILERPYLRLTTAPDASVVRPPEVLKQTLELLKRKWCAEGNYAYICDQFKSIRQDLMVQRIKTEFTVQVYELHARIALEKGDLGEYNQCQTRLSELYEEGLKGARLEFLAYRIIYTLFTQNRSGMLVEEKELIVEINELLATLSPAEKNNENVVHALDVRKALASRNYHRLFRLYNSAPNMGGYLMDFFVERERVAACCIICKSYRPEVDVRFITDELGFESDSDCVEFLEKRNAEIIAVEGRLRIKTKEALEAFEVDRRKLFRVVDIKGQL